jgi:pimeloyl-ACP methyl ester carboxylesterase
MKTFFRKLFRIWAAFGLLATVLFFAYMFLSLRASPEAREALQSDSAVQITSTSTHAVFTPVSGVPLGALVFFSGAMVDPAAYAPLLRRVAEHGYKAVLIPLPARSAPTQKYEQEAIERARSVIAAEPSLQWVVGGHSKGGYLASETARQYPDLPAGLLLVGTSHPREADLSQLAMPVVKVYGSRDGLASVEEIQLFSAHLPQSTRYIEVAGGNHAQFGYYGFQLGDRRATISRDEQQAHLLRAVLDLLQQVSGVPAG